MGFLKGNKINLGRKQSFEQLERKKIAMTGSNNPSKRPEVREKIRLAKLGKKRVPFTEEHKRNMSLASKRQKPWLVGRKQSEEHKLKISMNSKRIKQTPEHKEKLRLLLLGNKYFLGRKHTEETKRKQRESALIIVEKNGGPAIGKHEKQILNELEKLYNYKIDRTFRIIGYKVDGYIKELNLCIEIDEPHHFYYDGNLKIKDIKRQEKIEKELNCKFVRIKENEFLKWRD